MRDDLQELVDEVSRLLAAPATLEDADFTLLAFCAHDDSRAGAMDAVRTRSILTRGSPAADPRLVRGVRHRRPPRRRCARPADPARRHPHPPGHPRAARRAHPRLPVAARRRPHRSRRRGRPGPGRRGRPRRGGRPAARRARRGRRRPRPAARRGAHRQPRGRARRRVRALGRGPRRATPPRCWWRWPRARRGLPGRLAAARSRRGRRGAARTATGRAVLVPAAAPGRPAPRRRPRRRVARRPAGGQRRRGLRVRPGCGELPAQWAQARAAARVAAAVPRFSPVAHWAELGAWRPVSELPGPDPAVAPLLADRVLAETAEAFLDSAGSASRAAAALRPPPDALLPARPHRRAHRPGPGGRRGPAAAAHLAQGRPPAPVAAPG